VGVSLEGTLICVEGIDGAGKSTQTEMLAERLKDSRSKVIIYNYPDYSSRYGRIIKDYLYGKIEMENDEFFFLQMLDKQKDRAKIRNDMNEGSTIIMNRYIHSQIAYQCASGFDYESAKKIINLSKMPLPDIVVYIDVDIGTALKRKKIQKSGNLDRNEKSEEYLQTVKNTYKKLESERFGCRKWLRVDGNRDYSTIHEEIYMEVCNILKIR
jgi:dTMP kinase